MWRWRPPPFLRRSGKYCSCVVRRYRAAWWPLLPLIWLAVSGLCSGQEFPDSWLARAASVRYPPLAEAVRLQGEVRLQLTPDGPQIMSGPPLLLGTVSKHARALGLPENQTQLNLVYRFVFIENAISVQNSVTVERTNPLFRVVLKALGIRTTKTVLQSACQEVPAPPSRVTASSHDVEIEVYGQERCLMVEQTGF